MPRGDTTTRLFLNPAMFRADCGIRHAVAAIASVEDADHRALVTLTAALRASPSIDHHQALRHGGCRGCRRGDGDFLRVHQEGVGQAFTSGAMVAEKNRVWRIFGSRLTMRSTSGMKPMSSMRSASSMHQRPDAVSSGSLAALEEIDQGTALDGGVDVLIATPGRLLDLFERGKILMNDVRTPGDRRSRPHAGHGLHPGCRAHRQPLPKIRQTLLFSATMPRQSSAWPMPSYEPARKSPSPRRPPRQPP